MLWGKQKLVATTFLVGAFAAMVLAERGPVVSPATQTRDEYAGPGRSFWLNENQDEMAKSIVLSYPRVLEALARVEWPARNPSVVVTEIAGMPIGVRESWKRVPEASILRASTRESKTASQEAAYFSVNGAGKRDDLTIFVRTISGDRWPDAELVEAAPGARLAMSEQWDTAKTWTALQWFEYVVAQRQSLSMDGTTMKSRANAVRLLSIFSACRDAQVRFESADHVAFASYIYPEQSNERTERLQAEITVFDRKTGKFRSSMNIDYRPTDREIEPIQTISNVILSGMHSR